MRGLSDLGTTRKNLEEFKVIYDQIPGNGWLSENEAKLLWFAVTQSTGPILEVGCYQGRSTCLLAATLRPVYAVDPFNDEFDDTNPGEVLLTKFKDNLLQRNLHNVQLYRQKIKDWKPQPVNFAYLDGDHTYPGTLEQITIATRLCNATHVCIHDYESVPIKNAVSYTRLNVLAVVERMAYCERTDPPFERHP